MTTKQEKYTKRVKSRMVARDMSVNQLAEKLGNARESVSRAIHRGKNPGVREGINKELGIK